MEKRRRFQVWKMNKKTGSPSHVDFLIYFDVGVLYFIISFIVYTISRINRGAEHSIDLVYESLKDAAFDTVIWIILFYLLTFVIGFFIHADGDWLTSHIYSVWHRFRASNQLVKHTIYRATDFDDGWVSQTFLDSPVSTITYERIEIVEGCFRRVPMALNKASLMSNDGVVFDACHLKDIFNRDHAVIGLTAEELISKINTKPLSPSTKKLFRHVDGLAVVELSVVYSKKDNRIKLKVTTIECVSNAYGKLVEVYKDV